jgi:hypothetical protein
VLKTPPITNDDWSLCDERCAGAAEGYEAAHDVVRREDKAEMKTKKRLQKNPIVSVENSEHPLR